MSHFKTIALALSLKAEATEAEVLQSITTLKTEKETAETELTTLQAEIKAANKTEAVQLINTAVEILNLKDEAKANFVKTYETLFEADHANTKKALLASMPTAAPSANADLGQFMKQITGMSNAGSDLKLSFDYMQKHNPKKLTDLKLNDPEKYLKLVNDYAAGVRYKEPTN